MANTFSIKIEENSDVFQKIAELMEREKIEEVFLVKATGKMRNPEIVRHGKQSSVFSEKLRGDYDVNAISGNIVRKKNSVNKLVNVAVNQTGVNAKVGQLIKAIAGRDLELTLKKVDLSKMIM